MKPRFPLTKEPKWIKEKRERSNYHPDPKPILNPEWVKEYTKQLNKEGLTGLILKEQKND